MPHTIGFGKLQKGVLSNERLPVDLRIAIIDFKNEIKAYKTRQPGAALPEEFENREEGLPETAAGQTYYEYDVGRAHPGETNPRLERGKRRLAALVDCGNNILKMYFTDAHYTLGSWMQLQYP